MNIEERRKIKTKDAVIIYVVATIFSLLMAVPLVFAKEGFAKIAINYLIPQVSYAICIFGYIYAGKFKVLDVIPLKKKVSPILIFLSVIIAPALIAQDYILMLGFTLLMEKIGVKMAVEIPQMTNWYTVMITLFVIVILPPIFEELMFRGVFLSSLKQRGVKYTILVTAAIFALAHLNAAQLVHQFIVGIVLGYVVYKSGNVVYSIVIHMTNNILALVLPYWGFYNSLSSFSTKNTLIMLTFMVGGAFILFVCIKFFKKECKTLDAIETFEKRERKKQALWYNTPTINNIENEPFIPQTSRTNLDAKSQELIEDEPFIPQASRTHSDAKSQELIEDEPFTPQASTMNSDAKSQEMMEDELIDKALKSLKDNPQNLIDLWILGLCSFLAILLIYTTVTLNL